MLQRACAVVETVLLGVWVGALAGFAFVFAPIAFRATPDLDVFARIAERSIVALGTLGYACGAIAIAAALARSREPSSRSLAYARIGLIVAALALSAYDAHAILPQMTRTAASFHAPFASVAKSDPRRVAYDSLHSASSRVYGAALLCGLLALALSAVRRS